MNKFMGTCFKGARARSQDFFVISRDTLVFFDTSAVVLTADDEYAGGDGRSDDVFDLEENNK